MVQVTPIDLEKNFLDEEGLNYFWGKIDNAKVDKVSGKGLSTNDYTTTEKNKLSGIATGAEVNQNAFSNVADGTNTIAASGKTDTFTIAAASGTNGTSVSADTSTKTVKISSPRYTMTYTSSGTGGVLKLNEGIGGVVTPISTANLVGFISDDERTLLSGLGTYSSTEVAVGTWLNGQTIYRKVISGTPSAQSGNVQHGISDFGAPINCYGFYKRNSDGAFEPMPGTYTNWECWMYDFTSTKFTLRFSNNAWNSGIAFYNIILEYIKTGS